MEAHVDGLHKWVRDENGKWVGIPLTAEERAEAQARQEFDRMPRRYQEMKYAIAGAIKGAKARLAYFNSPEYQADCKAFSEISNWFDDLKLKNRWDTKLREEVKQAREIIRIEDTKERMGSTYELERVVKWIEGETWSQMCSWSTETYLIARKESLSMASGSAGGTPRTAIRMLEELKRIITEQDSQQTHSVCA